MPGAAGSSPKMGKTILQGKGGPVQPAVLEPQVQAGDDWRGRLVTWRGG